MQAVRYTFHSVSYNSVPNIVKFTSLKLVPVSTKTTTEDAQCTLWPNTDSNKTQTMKKWSCPISLSKTSQMPSNLHVLPNKTIMCCSPLLSTAFLLRGSPSKHFHILFTGFCSFNFPLPALLACIIFPAQTGIQPAEHQPVPFRDETDGKKA